MTLSGKVVLEGERYALWPDGTFCRINEVDRYVLALGHDYQEVIGVGCDDSFQAFVTL